MQTGQPVYSYEISFTREITTVFWMEMERKKKLWLLSLDVERFSGIWWRLGDSCQMLIRWSFQADDFRPNSLVEPTGLVWLYTPERKKIQSEYFWNIFLWVTADFFSSLIKVFVCWTTSYGNNTPPVQKWKKGRKNKYLLDTRFHIIISFTEGAVMILKWIFRNLKVVECEER